MTVRGQRKTAPGQALGSLSRLRARTVQTTSPTTLARCRSRIQGKCGSDVAESEVLQRRAVICCLDPRRQFFGHANHRRHQRLIDFNRPFVLGKVPSAMCFVQHAPFFGRSAKRVFKALEPELAIVRAIASAPQPCQGQGVCSVVGKVKSGLDAEVFILRIREPGDSGSNQSRDLVGHLAPPPSTGLLPPDCPDAHSPSMLPIRMICGHRRIPVRNPVLAVRRLRNSSDV